mmetsp:Transcript_8986/g.16203  ORF Transcript_8986/g.16203 Transcript_8986/m.16203 type:complete len:333 (+) Transcript_8986:56-1054(+)
MADSKLEACASLTVLGGGRTVSVAKLSAGVLREVGYLRAGGDEVVFAVAGHRHFCVVAFYSGRIEVWDMVKCWMLASCQGHRTAIWAILLNIDRNIVVSGGADRNVKVWSLDAEQEVLTLQQAFTGHTGNILTLSADCESQIAASGGSDRNIWLWPLEGVDGTRTVTCLPDRHTSMVNAVALVRRGPKVLVISASSDGTVCMSDIDPDVPILQVLRVEGATFRSMIASNDGSVILACSGQFVHRWYADGQGDDNADSQQPVRLVSDSIAVVDGIEGDIVASFCHLSEVDTDSTLVVTTTHGEAACLDFGSLRTVSLDTVSDGCPVQIGAKWD